MRISSSGSDPAQNPPLRIRSGFGPTLAGMIKLPATYLFKHYQNAYSRTILLGVSCIYGGITSGFPVVWSGDQGSTRNTVLCTRERMPLTIDKVRVNLQGHSLRTYEVIKAVRYGVQLQSTSAIRLPKPSGGCVCTFVVSQSAIH
ncbi:hypothetical protein DM02DRAFT_125760 [Periconia macrospinosa]|uniref:Uncharacterized protein n=1 Tax=Periconia macrospinosa TaxID=97972 RepID=A0A2V1E4M9_9PLEO|nr:hypothetical protein DM02DRAFT_125760 [Periconia macrospinosa]